MAILDVKKGYLIIFTKNLEFAPKQFLTDK